MKLFLGIAFALFRAHIRNSNLITRSPSEVSPASDLLLRFLTAAAALRSVIGGALEGVFLAREEILEPTRPAKHLSELFQSSAVSKSPAGWFLCVLLRKKG